MAPGKIYQACSSCPGNSFTIDSDTGFYYCDNCSTQADIVEASVDYDNFTSTYSQSQKRKDTAPIEDYEDDDHALHSPPIAAVPISQIKTTDPLFQPTHPMDFGSGSRRFSPEDYSVSIRERYLSGMQVVIQLQCEALVEKFGVSPVIGGLFGPIWLRFLASTGVMGEDWADETALFSETQHQAGQDEEFDIPNATCNGEPVNMYKKRLVIIWFRSLASKIHVSCSLAITFLVCHLAREPVLPTDIVKWAREGKLPYLAAFGEVDKHLGERSGACPINSAIMFKPSQVISTQQLEAQAAKIAQIIGLSLPPVNFYAIALRYCRQLCLPTEVILPKACQIFEWFLLPELHLSANNFRIPTRAHVMSILIVAIRILFDINGYGFWESSLSDLISSPQREEDGDKDQCHRTACADENSPLENAEPHGTTSELPDSKLNVGELLGTLEAKSIELDDSYDYFRDLSSYLQYCKDVVFSGSKPSYEEQDEQALLDVLWQFYLHNKVTKPEFSDLNDNQSRKANGKSSCTEESYKDRAIREMKSQMEDNKFCYIAPRSNIKRRHYLHYRRKRKDVYIYAVHADYYILLRSCAKVAQVETRIMHAAVLSFEKRLEWLEKQMDSSLTLKPNLCNFCDFCRDDL